MKKTFVVIILMVLVFCVVTLKAEDGVTETEIILGQSCALNGPASALGTGMKAGLFAAFEESNAAGGINGRKIKLISIDDGYEPDLAIINTRYLIEQEKVFMLIGEVGTPTSKAVVPIAVESSVPFFGPFTGVEFLRNPYNKWIVNVRGSYNQEMERIVEYLVDDKGMKKIACFYQNDGYGQAGLDGLKLAMEKRNVELAAEGSYKRNTVAIKRGLLDIRKAEVQAIVMVGAYKPCAEFIKLAKKLEMTDVVYCNISFVGTAALKDELGADGQDCIISQVMPLPNDTSIGIVSEYNNALVKYQPGEVPDFTSLEGYVVGKLFCKAAAAVKGELTREALVDIIAETGRFDLNGISLTYGPQDNHGSEAIYLTKIDNGEIVEIK